MENKSRLDPKETVIYLASQGVKTSIKTLNKYRCVGGGPVYRKINNKRVIYEKDALDSWIESILSKPICNTSYL